MSLILHIDTAQETAFVSIASDGDCIDVIHNHVQKDHASFLHPAIKELLQRHQYHFSDLDAVAVTKGPGSYTGIRVGMAAAKGIAFALNKPLIAISNLDLLARAVKINYPNEASYICPMIDARRMEVFTALYDHQLILLSGPAAIILHKDYLLNFRSEKNMIVVGSGAAKWCELINHPDLIHFQNPENHIAISKMAQERLYSGHTDHLIDCEPLYVKEFQNL